MKAKQAWAILSLTWCLLLNLVLAGLLHYLGEQVLLGMSRWMNVLLQITPPGVPEEVQWAYANLGKIVGESRACLAPVVWGLAGVATFVLWWGVYLSGCGYGRRVREEAVSTLPPSETGEDSPIPEGNEPGEDPGNSGPGQQS
ncbi:MAG TPA: hypothetical protein PLM79_13830 [Syntrophobacteraceae bacterium]|nr:hypothetical protein [Syntrophobacteraceae bacterium]